MEIEPRPTQGSLLLLVALLGALPLCLKDRGPVAVHLSNKYIPPSLVKLGGFLKVAAGVGKGIPADALSHGDENVLQGKDVANTRRGKAVVPLGSATGHPTRNRTDRSWSPRAQSLAAYVCLAARRMLSGPTRN